MPRSKLSLVLNFDLQYLNFEILKLNDLYTFEIAKLVYQFNHKKLPSNFLITLHILLIFHLNQRGILLITISLYLVSSLLQNFSVP